MKKRLQDVLKRIDALSLRERVFLFICLIAISMVLADVLWLSPVQTTHKRITQRFAAQNGELLRLQEELKASSAETGPGRKMREELVQLRERQAAVNEQIAQMPLSEIDATPLSRVLVHFLRRHEGLTLVRTATQPPAGASAGDPKSPPGLRRQGLELTVSGSYPELNRYVQTLEHALPALRWGSMKVAAEQQPVQLTLQVSLVGAAP